MPIDVGPSLTEDPVPSAGLYWAPAGDYAVAVDSARRRGGAFRLRFWIERRDAARARAPARLERRADAAHPGDGRGLGRRSALPRVRAGAAGLVDRQRLPPRLGRSGGASRRSPSAGCGRALCARACASGDYAESRDALAIALSPQHVRTRVIGLAVDTRGAIHVAAGAA